MKMICAKPRVSAYNFMRFLCAALVAENKAIVNLNSIVDKINDFRKSLDEDSQFILGDIEFRESIDNVVSYDISEGLNSLQTFGVIGKLNPAYEKVVIHLTVKEANEILDQCEAEVRDKIKELAISF